MTIYTEREVLDTLREGLLVLDTNLAVVFANESFLKMFSVQRDQTEGRKLYDLGDGQWNIPPLRDLLENVIPRAQTVESYEVAHVFPGIGYRVMLLNARKVVLPQNHVESLILVMEDITDRRAIEIEKESLSERLRQATLEADHRIKNSLTVLSSFIRLQNRAATGEEAKTILNSIASRIDAISRLYESLSHHADIGAPLPVAKYVTALCENIQQSAIDPNRITLNLEVEEFELNAERLVAVGLAINELVLNAAKHAFPNEGRGQIDVRVRRMNASIELTVADDGVGLAVSTRTDSGLGQLFLRSFVERLNGKTDFNSSSKGTSVRISFPLDLHS